MVSVARFVVERLVFVVAGRGVYYSLAVGSFLVVNASGSLCIV